MEFRLVYKGQLKSSGNETRKDQRSNTDHKHEIRCALHPQIRELWKYSPLNYTFGEVAATQSHAQVWHDPEYIAKSYNVNDWKFVPLVRSDVYLVAQLDILMLRPGTPGSIIQQGGDIDNRLKTLFDALRAPKEPQEIPQGIQPSSDESPLYCLLADDSLVTSVSVNTDRLLQTYEDASQVEMVIHVTVRPEKYNSHNEGF